MGNDAFKNEFKVVCPYFNLDDSLAVHYSILCMQELEGISTGLSRHYDLDDSDFNLYDVLVKLFNQNLLMPDKFSRYQPDWSRVLIPANISTSITENQPIVLYNFKEIKNVFDLLNAYDFWFTKKRK